MRSFAPIGLSLGTLLAAVSLSPGCSSSRATAPVAKAGPPAALVRVATSESRTIPIEISAIGNVEAFTTITVKSQVTGVLDKVHFLEGATVQAGDALFEIDARPYKEALRQFEANLARNKAVLQQGEANLARAQAQEVHYGKQAERYERLAAEGIFSREVADQASLEARGRRTAVRAETAAIESAKAAIRADEAAVDNARLNLSYCTIRSPIAGRTGDLHLNRGNLVKANDVELVTIHQIQPTYVAFTVPEASLLLIRDRLQGLTVRASIPDDTRPPVSGKVTFLDNKIDTSTGTVRLKATFSNSDARLWPGQFVDVRIGVEERPNAVLVPAGAIQAGQVGNFVYVVKGDQTVEMRPVTAGPRIGANIAIDRGLTAGEVVVIEGHLRLAPGMKVRVAS